MSLFTRRVAAPVVEERAAQRVSVAGSGGWFMWPGPEGESDPLKSVAHWAARRVLCTSIAGLPVQQIRETKERRERVTPSQIVADPDGTGDQAGWVYQVMDSWLDDGNVYGLVTAANSLGLPTQVQIVAPSAVQWLPVNGTAKPHVNGTPFDVWPNGYLWHSAAFLRAGSPIGLSPTKYAAQSVKTSVAAEKFGGDFLTDGGHPSAIVKAKSALTEDQAKAIKSAFLRATRGSREPAVMGGDLEYEAIQVDPKDSQFLDLLRFECEQAARIYGVPPGMIYAATSGQSVTYANASQDDLAFLKHGLRWWVNRLQGQWSRFLPAPQVVRLNVDAFLQMTTRERAEIHDIRLKQRSRTVNEVRGLEDEPPFDDPIYDEPGIPVPTQMALPLGGAT